MRVVNLLHTKVYKLPAYFIEQTMFGLAIVLREDFPQIVVSLFWRSMSGSVAHVAVAYAFQDSKYGVELEERQRSVQEVSVGLASGAPP